MSWKILPERSSVNFQLQEYMFMPVEFRFAEFNGWLKMDGSAHPLVSLNINTPSLTSGNLKRDDRLRAFFDTARHPLMTFESHKVERINSFHLRILGDLTLRGVTHPVMLEAEPIGLHSETRCGYSIHTRINRKDWQMSDLPGKVGSTFHIHLVLAAAKQQNLAAAV